MSSTKRHKAGSYSARRTVVGAGLLGLLALLSSIAPAPTSANANEGAVLFGEPQEKWKPSQRYDERNDDLDGFHTGVDSTGNPNVVAVAPGRVAEVVNNDVGCDPPPPSGQCEDHGLGNTVIVQHRTLEGQTVYSLYGHLARIDVEKGWCLNTGDDIGVMGASAYGTPYLAGRRHLHLEIKDAAVLNTPNPRTDQWGYIDFGSTPSHPNDYGYHDPEAFIGQREAVPICEKDGSPAPVPLPSGADDAQLTAGVVGVTVRIGQPFVASFSFENTGRSTWIEDRQYRLGRRTWDDPLGAPPRVFLSSEETIRPGEKKEWQTGLTPLVAPGIYEQAWQMIRESKNWFGEVATITVTVLPPEVAVVPSSGTAGTVFQVNGTGFALSSTVTSHLQRPDGSVLPTLTLPTTVGGSYVRVIDTFGFEPGIYQTWAVDDATAAVSNAASFEVLPPFPLHIAGGTWFDRDLGLIGTAFMFESRIDGEPLPYVDISGPSGWNGGNTFRSFAFAPPGISADRAMWWDLIPPVTGTYIATGQTSAGPVQVPLSIDASSQLPPPTVEQAIVTADGVEISWNAHPSARSFLVRLNDIPFPNFSLGEILLPSQVRNWTFGLNLPPGNYQAVVWAFPENLTEPGTIQTPFNISSDSLFFAEP